MTDVATFVHAHLPPAPARVLEVGCGLGELAREMDGHGYDVTAIDPDAPAGDIFQPVSLAELTDPGPFDAVVANRSLHHIESLPPALDKIRRLLSPEGRLIVYEHAPDRFDEATARWYIAHREEAHHHEHDSVQGVRSAWARDHEGLHGSATIRSELDLRFAEEFFAWVPYLYGEIGLSVEAEERRLIDEGAIQATGFYYVGVRRDVA